MMLLSANETTKSKYPIHKYLTLQDTMSKIFTQLGITFSLKLCNPDS